jgi:hypothetical protein
MELLRIFVLVKRVKRSGNTNSTLFVGTIRDKYMAKVSLKLQHRKLYWIVLTILRNSL